MPATQWEVVGGGDKGGIIVRQGKELASPQERQRLATGAIVETIEQEGDRLHYALLQGDGPRKGWVSIRLKDKVLLEQCHKAASKENEVRSEANSAESANAAFAKRLEELKDKFPGMNESMLPKDAWKWSQSDLENFIETDGFIKPKGAMPKQGVPPPVPPQSSQPKAPPAAAAAKRTKAKEQSAPDIPQFSNVEALQLQDQLRMAFAEKEFQGKLSELNLKFPQRKTRGHDHGVLFFEAFEALSMTIYSKVLPRYGLQGDWDGVRDMHAKMITALMHPKVKKQQEEINTLLGLPRDAVFKGGKKETEMFVYRPQRDAAPPAPPLALLEDEEGDTAHEFFVEDAETGEMKRGLSSLDADCWYRVVHKPHVLIRSKPDTNSLCVGKKTTGERIRVQKVDGKWLQLHSSEIKKLKVKDAWALCDGTDLKLGELLVRE